MRSRLPLLASLLLAACAAPALPCAGLPGAPMLSATLYFGRSTPDGPVEDAAWQGFLASAVTPRFPAGFTVLPASGQWRRADGTIITEPSTVLLVVAPRGQPTLDALAAVRDEYRLRFRQESVGLALGETCAAF